MLARITANLRKCCGTTKGLLDGLVRVGVVLVAGESTIGRKVDYGV
jgi:hypothetical protein